MTKVRENIILGTNKVVAEDVFIYSTDGEGASLNEEYIEVGDIVIYNPETNKAVGPGVVATGVNGVPKLAIAQVIGDEYGQPRTLRGVFGGSVDSRALTNVTTEPPRCGCNNVVDLFPRCTKSGKNYTATIEVRNDDTLKYNLWNQWTPYTASVDIEQFACDSCDTGIDESEVMCALADKFNAHTKDYPIQFNGGFLKSALSQQAKDRGFTVYPLFENDYTYDVGLYADGCDSCVDMDSIGGIVINGNTHLFTGTTKTGDNTKSYIYQKDRILRLINKAFVTEGQRGHAVVKEQLTGTGAPCCDFQILINSCVVVSLLEGDGVSTITPASSGSPFTAITKDPNCVGCNAQLAWTPTAGLRAVANPLPIKCANGVNTHRRAWYHTEVRWQIPSYSGFKDYLTTESQAIVIPEGLGVQWAKRMLNQASGGPGRDHEQWVVDLGGDYMTPLENTAFTENSTGLICKSLYCGISMEHGLTYHADQHGSNGNHKSALGTSIMLIENSNTTLYAAVKAILDPWLASAGFPPVTCSSDVDQDQGTAATGILTLTGQPLDTETIVVGTKTYTAQTVLTDVDGNFLIGATASDSLDNLIAAITLGAGAGTTYATSMTKHTKVTAAAGAGDTMDVTALLTGEAGNTIATTETLTNGSWGNTTLTGGTYPGSDLGT